MASFDVAVVGAGVFGSWTALHLRRAGRSVLLCDAWGPGHSRSSSGDETRIIRMGYGADRLYTEMARRSLAQWQELFSHGKQPLFLKTGVLWMAHERDVYARETLKTFTAADISFRRLERRDLAERYPQIQLAERDVFAILEPDSGALMARRAVAAVVEEAVQSGVAFLTAEVWLDSERRVRTRFGELIEADQVVFACGAWLPKIFPDLLQSRIFPTRQEVLFFTPPPGDESFAPQNFPVWIDFSEPRGPYGFPNIERRGIKFAFDRHGPAFDPDSDDRLVSAASVQEARSFLAERFPALVNARLAETRICQYENTSSGDFLIDRHPDLENVWLVGGGSGHGFKHGPCVGQYAADQILGKGATEARFSFASKDVWQKRKVF
jgi:sarcosine oxidase